MRIFAPFILAISMLMLYVPLNPVLPEASLDPSWALGINELASRHAVFGKDVVFTQGPLAAVYTGYFHPAIDGVVMWVSALLSLAVIGCWWLILRGRSPWLWSGVAFACWLTILSRDALLFAIPLLASLATAFYILDQQKIESHGPKGQGSRGALIVLLLAWCSVGILPLIKGTMAVMCLALMLFTSVFLALKGHRILAIAIPVVSTLTSMLAWCGMGQPLGALPLFFGSMSTVIQGYTEAMSSGSGTLRTFIQLTLYGVVSWMLLRQGALFGLKYDRLTALFFVAVQSCGLFLSFKSAFVRHDEGHVITAINVAVVLMGVAFARFELPRSSRWKWLVLGGLLWFAVMGGVHNWSIARHLPQWWATQQSSIRALTDRVTKPEAIPNAFQAGFARIRSLYPLPRLKGSVDVYPTNQAVALAYGWEWQPRPTLQSYAAYTPELAQLNRDHLLGSRSPQWILFAIDPIDGRLASQEDGASWPALLMLYEPVQRVTGGILLKRRLSAGQLGHLPQGEVLLHRRAELGERVELPGSGGAMSLSIRVHKNLLGSFSQAAFKARSLILEVELQSGDVRKLRVISGMLVEDVIISPLVENTDEFALLYGDLSLLADKRVRTIRLVESAMGPSHWQGDFELTIRSAPTVGQQDNVSTRAVHLQFPIELAKSTVVEDITCQGYIDSINARKQSVQPDNHRFPLLRAQGWFVLPSERGDPPGQAIVLLRGQDGRKWKMALSSQARPDVEAHLGLDSASVIGWSSLGDLRSVPGTITMSLAYERDGSIRACGNLSHVLPQP